ncbi:SulP family inorganic anion transporter [Streptomyces stelliscabiei]|uniref:SulP family sulfate permease n=2 Tax=Streptomyces TaxID=1883 RepID=A0A8I0NZT9_9ACTN|nr:MULTISPECIES: SulP family inorganic anion transporter [Streptomyces]KND26247.1 MFS transporter [Streptomyces stelliscabiei]MBE1594272.1 SulP family sulfate permease [Streptomyces stelliscabiei]MDX2521212.1 SulP family inorganic anion transporter [Streptomyces stelliscabiei]MDX2556121.1 SulP family inorganic anion transporter [Streptomyces stelliscabiei]MDX2616708.1 SulP family inorganic anion transporter [Streptomyces stelliscabiei]
MSTFHTQAVGRVRSLLPARADLALMARNPRRDLLAGLTVAIVALPLALGFGVSSGLGAEAGLATAVVAGALAALFGGSNLQVSGPTGAMTVVLVPIVARYGPGGVLTVGLMAGVLLVALAFLKAGRYMRYIPAPVVEGFTLGIACVIALQQLPNALGVAKPEGDKVLVVTWRAVEEFAKAPNWTAVILALAVAAVMLLGARWWPTIPFSIVAVITATLVSQAFHLDAAEPIGDLPSGLPAPSLAFLDVSAVGSLLAPAVAVAALAALESLLSATVADGMTVGQQHDPDKELFGQGIANLAAPLFGGVPATAAIARTAVNVRTGAGSRLAALTHAAVLAGIVFAAAPLVSKIPLAALAGVLLATAIRMVEVGALRAMVKATRSDAIVLVLTACATLALDLVYAVVIGLVVAGALALRAVADQARMDQVDFKADLPGEHSEEEHALLAEHIVAYRIDGPLFFAGAHRFLLELSEVADVRVVILRMSRITTMDATGALVIKDAVAKLNRRGIAVLISGIRPGQRQALQSVGVLDLLQMEGREYANTPEAIAGARAHLHRAGLLPCVPVTEEACR